jgi:hypothetical protein
MGDYKRLSSIRADVTQKLVTVMELVHLAKEVWRYQRGAVKIALALWSSWFIGHVGKALLNKIRRENASEIVSLSLMFVLHLVK